jgi:hypothetical protein
LKRTWSFICTNCKDDLYQVWLKLAIYFWRRFYKGFFSNINTCKNGFPIVAPRSPNPRGPWFVLSWICTK